MTGLALTFKDRPATWTQALSMSSGYDSDLILQRVAAATREVVAGRAVFERDGVLFHERALPFSIAAAILRHAQLHGGQLDVVDFGGSLGSVYRQIAWFLPPLRTLRWQIIEQPEFVRLGRSEFETDALRFYERLDELPPPLAPRLVLLSSSLQYVPDPRHTLATLLATAGARTLVIDRTPFTDGPSDHLCIQHVPSRLYRASYPIWILSRNLTRQSLSSSWVSLVEFPSAEGVHQAPGGVRFEFAGLVAERRA